MPVSSSLTAQYVGAHIAATLLHALCCRLADRSQPCWCTEVTCSLCTVEVDAWKWAKVAEGRKGGKSTCWIMIKTGKEDCFTSLLWKLCVADAVCGAHVPAVLLRGLYHPLPQRRALHQPHVQTASFPRFSLRPPNPPIPPSLPSLAPLSLPPTPCSRFRHAPFLPHSLPLTSTVPSFAPFPTSSWHRSSRTRPSRCSSAPGSPLHFPVRTPATFSHAPRVPLSGAARSRTLLCSPAAAVWGKSLLSRRRAVTFLEGWYAGYEGDHIGGLVGSQGT
eukprot:708118-Rhodomonas_salina.1